MAFILYLLITRQAAQLICLGCISHNITVHYCVTMTNYTNYITQITDAKVTMLQLRIIHYIT